MGAGMKDFRQLKVWKKSHELALAIYHITASSPREETYGLASQIRRAASSIPSNIAEGCGRDGDAEVARFCIIARGSICARRTWPKCHIKCVSCQRRAAAGRVRGGVKTRFRAGGTI